MARKLITLLETDADYETPTFCPDCGRLSHYYQATVDWSTYDLDTLPRMAAPVWERIDKPHRRGCPGA